MGTKQQPVITNIKDTINQTGDSGFDTSPVAAVSMIDGRGSHHTQENFITMGAMSAPNEMINSHQYEQHLPQGVGN